MNIPLAEHPTNRSSQYLGRQQRYPICSACNRDLSMWCPPVLWFVSSHWLWPVSTNICGLRIPSHWLWLYQPSPQVKKQDAAHEPECSHVKHFCETSYGTVLYIFPLLLCQCPVDCGTRKRVECKAWGVKKVECWVRNVVCRVRSGGCGVRSVKCRVWIVKCKLWHVVCEV